MFTLLQLRHGHLYLVAATLYGLEALDWVSNAVFYTGLAVVYTALSCGERFRERTAPDSKSLFPGEM